MNSPSPKLLPSLRIGVISGRFGREERDPLMPSLTGG